MASRVFHRTAGGPPQQKTKSKSIGHATGGQHGAVEAKSPQTKLTNQEPHEESKPPLPNTSALQAVQLPVSSSSPSSLAAPVSTLGAPIAATTTLAQPPPLHPHHFQQQQQHHPHVPVHRPSTSSLSHGHTSHAMILQMQEYRERVTNACQSTYQFPLQRPRKPQSPFDSGGKKRNTTTRAKGYCRSHVMETNRQFFHPREPAPSHCCTPVGLKDKVLPKKGGDVYVNFHQMKPRKDEFLFGEQGNTCPKIAHDGNNAAGIAKDHFALGPGQCDVANLRPKTTTSVKLSPSDRFHENFSTDQLGPGQYITNEALTTPRAAVTVFSQTPRQTEAALLVSPTANIVSSYYYVPESSFLDKNAPKNDNPSWPRSPRLTSRRCTTASIEAENHRMEQSTVDFVAKNKSQLDSQSAAQRLRQARQLQGRLELTRSGRRRRRDGTGSDDGNENDQISQHHHDQGLTHLSPPTVFKRRSSIFLAMGSSQSPEHLTELLVSSSSPSKQTALVRKPSSSSTNNPNGALAALATASTTTAITKLIQENAKLDKALRGWITLACIAGFSVRISKIYHLVTIIRKIQSKEREQLQRVVFVEWKKLDHMRCLQYASHVIVANSFRFRFHMRIRKKAAHVSILRNFFGGLSIDAQFAIAIKKIKRKIQLIQRWWRHVQLMVKAREEALYHKWVNVETYLRLEYINQMPHLQRIFQQPSHAGEGMSGNGAGTNSNTSSSTSASSADMTLQKLLNLPEQKKWFTAHFVLTSDGCLRGYCSSGENSSDSKDSKENLVVEVKNYRCNFHESVSESNSGSDFALFDGSPTASGELSTSSLQAYYNYSSARWKPFLMVFRQGAFRFVLLTSASPMPTEIMAWKDKLERLVITPTDNSSNSSGVFGSISGPSGGNSGALQLSSSHNGGGNFGTSVSEFVEVSMQSGILASNSHGNNLQSPMQSFSSLAMLGGSFSPYSGSSVQLAAALTMGSSSSSRNLVSAPRGKLQARVRSIRQRNRMGMTVGEGELTYYVVDLLKDFPKVPTPIIWQTIRDKLREKRKSFRTEIYRYNLEMYHFHRHQEQTKHIHVLDKFKEFFTLERPKRPHFRSLISNRKMEVIIRQTIEQLKTAMSSTPKYLLDASKPPS